MCWQAPGMAGAQGCVGATVDGHFGWGCLGTCSVRAAHVPWGTGAPVPVRPRASRMGQQTFEKPVPPPPPPSALIHTKGRWRE